MTISFITGNKNKFEEARQIIPELVQLDIDLPEIQDVDPRKVVAAKLEEAKKHAKGAIIVEDTSLFLDSLKGLPGPLIKAFQQTIGLQGIVELAEKIGNKARAKTLIGYFDGNIKFFEGEIKGTIVQIQGNNGFGWDAIFKPDGFQNTMAEMTMQEKEKISMRGIALRQLKEFLNKPQES